MIKKYLVELQSLYLNYMLVKTELKFYNHLILEKIIIGIQKLYKDKDGY